VGTQWDSAGGTARYKGIADDLRRRLGDGEWEPGQQIPSLVELQGQYGGPSFNVIRDAESVLIAEGLLRADHGVGVFVVALPGRVPGQEAAELGRELERIQQAATRAAALWRQHQDSAGASGDPAGGGETPEVRRWGWMTGVDCPTCDLRMGSSRGWVDPDEPDPADEELARCRENEHPVRLYHGPDGDADQEAAAAVERWWERFAHAQEAARLLAAGSPGSAAAARWHARQVHELIEQMPDELAYRVHVTTA
jgi:DNA-binding transcriptional regulator YhcF (GntR family)